MRNKKSNKFYPVFISNNEDKLLPYHTLRDGCDWRFTFTNVARFENSFRVRAPIRASTSKRAE